MPPRGWDEAAKEIDLDVMDRSTHASTFALLNCAHSDPGLITCIRVDYTERFFYLVLSEKLFLLLFL